MIFSCLFKNDRNMMIKNGRDTLNCKLIVTMHGHVIELSFYPEFLVLIF